MVRKSGRPGKEDDGDQLHTRGQEIAQLYFDSRESHDSNVVTLAFRVKDRRLGSLARMASSLHFQSEETTNRLPSLSLNIAYVPQGCLCGGPPNSTPRFFSCSYVLSMSSYVYDMFMNEPIRFSSPSAVNNTTRVSAF